MKLFILLITFLPTYIFAQEIVPRFQNDTVYTTSGFKIYKGQTLKFGKGSGFAGKFRFIRLASGWDEAEKLTNTQVVVKKLSRYKVTPLNNAYVFILASIKFKDGSTGDIDFNMAFDNAMQQDPRTGSSELLVPDEFKYAVAKPIKQKERSVAGSVSDEIAKLHKLYQDSIITKEEYESQKKKILEQ